MKFVIVGCGRVGAGLARNLIQLGHAVAVVDQDPAAFARLGPGYRGQTVAGEATDPETLRRAGAASADGLAAVTAQDAVNVACARLARETFGVPRVVARVYDPQQAALYERSGLPTVSTTTWGIGRLADLLCYSPLHAVYSVPAGDVDLVEADVPPLLAGHTVLELGVPGQTQVVAITRGAHSFLPSPGAQIQEGDRLYVAVAAGSADRLRALLGPE